MDKDSIQYLKTSLENENNIPIFDLTSAYIKKSKEAVIQELPITKNNFNELKKNLKITDLSTKYKNYISAPIPVR